MPKKKSGKKSANKNKAAPLKVEKAGDTQKAEKKEQKDNFATEASPHNQFMSTPKKEQQYTDVNFWRDEIDTNIELDDLDDFGDDVNNADTSSSTVNTNTIKVVVGSTNPVKINSVKEAFQEVFPSREIEVVGVSTASGISDQPMSEKATKEGATNRATGAAKNCSFDPHYAVGLEGGISKTSSGSATVLYDCFAWMAVYDVQKSTFSYARTASFTLPAKVCKLVSQGMELGTADDVVFKRENSKQSDGTVGILTHGLIDRTCYYKHALIFALVPAVNPELY